MIRDALLSDVIDSNKPVVGTLTMVYDHHVPNLAQKLTEMQHHSGTMVLAATHVHLDHHYCLEVISMKGKSNPKWTDALAGIGDSYLYVLEVLARLSLRSPSWIQED